MANVQVNGQERTFEGDPSMPLMWYLRDELGLTGTKFGCGVGVVRRLHRASSMARRCAPARSPMSDVAGKKVVTIEGLDPKGEHPVQVAWRNLGVPQCGYCQTGQIMQAAALLAKNARAHRRRDRQPPWPAICAAAAAISAFTRPFAPPPRGHDMTDHRHPSRAHHRQRQPPRHAQGRRRRRRSRARRADSRLCSRRLAYPTGAEQMPNGVRHQPAHLPVDRQGRHRDASWRLAPRWEPAPRAPPCR